MYNTGKCILKVCIYTVALPQHGQYPAQEQPMSKTSRSEAHSAQGGATHLYELH